MFVCIYIVYLLICISNQMNTVKHSNIFLYRIILIVSLGGLLFGFDMAVISGIIPFIKQQFSLSAMQEGWLVSSALVGCIFGVVFSGEWSDRYGRRKLLYLAAVFFLICALGSSVAASFTWIVISRLIGGLGVGIASIVVPLYIAEISPASIRGRMVTFYQLALTAGILIAYVSNAWILNTHMLLFFNEQWRSMLFVGIIPAVLFLIGLFFIPESPRWLVQNGQQKLAEQIAASVGAEIAVGVAKETKGSYKNLISPTYRKAFLLGILLPLFSQLSGINAIVYFGPSILLEAGVPLDGSFQAQIIFGVGNLLFTLIAIWKVDSIGRRPLYIIGTLGATTCLFLAGWCFQSQHQGSNTLLMASILGFLLFFAFSIGPLKFVVASEIFPGAIRGRAMAISILVMWIADATIGQLTPVMLNTWGPAYTFWFFGICCAIAFITVFYMLPETKGKSLEQIEAYWTKEEQLRKESATL